MKIKKYVAATMPEAMQQIRKELGKEAVILNSREIRKGGFLGLFSKKQLEVVAALDPDATEQKIKPTSKSYIEEISDKNTAQNSNSNELLAEIRQLKQMVKSTSNLSASKRPMELEYVYDFLISQNVERDIAEEIVQSTLSNLPENDKNNSDLISRAIIRQIEHMLQPIQAKLLHNQNKRITYLVGPTGAGKTTTIAKLAAKAMLTEKKKVAFITGDTYRIAAIDQLKTYAKILEVPVEVAYEPSEFSEVAVRLKDYEKIFADTAGRNFKEARYIKEIKQIIENSPPAHIVLVLPLTGKSEDINHIAEQFADIPISSVLFTKLDETSSFGSILNIALKYGWPISHIANGQDVPDDIFEPTISEISNLFAGGMKNA